MERAKVIFTFTSEWEDELSIQVYCLTPSHPHTSHPHTVTPHTPTPSHYHTPTLPHPHTVTPPHCHTPTPLHTHTPTPSHPHTATPPYPHPVTPPTGGPHLIIFAFIYILYTFTHRTPHLSYFTLTPHVPGW